MSDNLGRVLDTSVEKGAAVRYDSGRRLRGCAALARIKPYGISITIKVNNGGNKSLTPWQNQHLSKPGLK